MQLEKEAAIELMLKTGEIEEVTPAARASVADYRYALPSPAP